MMMMVIVLPHGESYNSQDHLLFIINIEFSEAQHGYVGYMQLNVPICVSYKLSVYLTPALIFNGAHRLLDGDSIAHHHFPSQLSF